MSPAAAPSTTAVRPSMSRRGYHAASLSRPARSARRGGGLAVHNRLGSYIAPDGRDRELLAVPGNRGSVLVLDRDAATLCDRRLIAHLAADEPCENAALVCNHYLKDANGRWCRNVRPEDLRVAPFAEDEPRTTPGSKATEGYVLDRNGNAYGLRSLSRDRRIPQLRWCRRPASSEDSRWEQVSLREVIGALESYEPVRALSERAIASHHGDQNISLTRLRYEFDRLCASPIVLNRGLREAVLDLIARSGVSMSEIALRCDVVKRDRRGKLSGETSWLARRIGIMPEGGKDVTTPWIHSDVLAAIARKGLGISPREVELQ